MKKGFLCCVLALVVTVCSGGSAEAAKSSGSVKVTGRQGLVNAVYAMMARREESGLIYYKGDSKKIFDDDVKGLIADVCAIDRKDTSDDADYLENSIYQMSVKTTKNTKGSKVKESVLSVSVSYYEDSFQLAEVNRKVKEILNRLDLDGKSKYRKIKMIHDYVVKYLTYSHNGSYPYTAYGAVTDRNVVCQGYAQLTYKLLTEAGIQCRSVIGKSYSDGKIDDHVWNVVKLKGKWYYLDTTWDDPVGNGNMLIHDYFLKGSKTFKKDHLASKRYKALTSKVSKQDYRK